MGTQKRKQRSESFFVGGLLTMAGGFFDAYTYLTRGHVFANAQTGNLVLFGLKMAEGRGLRACAYLIPVFSFAAGVLVSQWLRFLTRDIRLHWRQWVLMVEFFLILIIGFLPQGKMDMAANVLVSFLCALQVETFRKLEGKAYATTMCTGNLRSGTESLILYWKTREKQALSDGVCYLAILTLFVLGAITGAFAAAYWREKSIWLCEILIFASFLAMFQKNKQ